VRDVGSEAIVLAGGASTSESRICRSPMRCARAEDSLVVARQGRGVLRGIGLARHSSAHAATNEFWPLMDLGRWDEARIDIEEELGLVQPGSWRAVPLQARAWLNWLTGDIDQAERDVDEIQRLAPDLTECQFLSPQAQVVAAVAIGTERWETALQTVAETVRQLPVEDGHPVVHWETMSAAWLGLWAAADLARERGQAGSAWLAPHLAELDRLLAAAARRPLEQRTIRVRRSSRCAKPSEPASRAAPPAQCGGKQSRPPTPSEPWRSAPTPGYG
jgi:hypothetical protein